MITLSSFHSKPVYITIGLVFFVLCWDFFSRVWYPLESDEGSVTEQVDVNQLEAWEFGDTPYYLDEWMHQAEREAAAQRESDAEETEEEAARRREAERERRLRPMAGSTELDEVRIRVRAVFKHSGANGRELSLVIAEAQTIATGNVERIVLREGEMIGGYVLSEVSANAVYLTHEQRDPVRLRVFEFN